MAGRKGNTSVKSSPMFEGNGRTAPGARAETIYQLVRAWAEDTPEAIALVAPRRPPITYERLLNQIDAVAKSLREMGIDHDHRIIMVMPNGIELAAMFLGVSCSAISVPLNPACQENEIESYLSGLGAKAVLVQSAGRSPAVAVAQRHRIPVIELVSTQSGGSSFFTLKVSAAVSSARQHQLEPDDVALILHTSGTTSKPKRVPLTHRNLSVSAYAVRDALELTSADRCLGVMPLFHIHGLVGGLLSSLAAGASFVATPTSNPSHFFDSMKAFKPTWYTAVPAFHQAILKEVWDRGQTVETGSLRFIRSASAPLSKSVMTQLEEVFNVPVIEAYGMTEASHQITSNLLPPRERKRGSVGVPARTEVAIMNETGDFLTTGQVGEVVIRGANVTAGYEREANKASFVNGWFRTGDLGYLDGAGYLFLTGRLKEIINRGGEKISPREIDEILLDHPEVLQAAAFPVPHQSLGEDVAAAVVTRDSAEATEASLRDHLTRRVAAFKVPARVLIVDEIPKGPTGKINRKALAEAFAEALRVGFVAPKNDLEDVVAKIYADVLKVSRVGADDNFFSLGGDSLRAMQVISRVRSLFSVNLPIATLFLKTTVAELAEEIAALVKALPPTSREAVCAELKEVSGRLRVAVQPNQDDSEH